MLPDRVSNPGPLTYESGALPIALRGPAILGQVFEQRAYPYQTSPKGFHLHYLEHFAVKEKIYGVLYNQASSIAIDETSSYWSALKSS